jgi:hypothetical protein
MHFWQKRLPMQLSSENIKAFSYKHALPSFLGFSPQQNIVCSSFRSNFLHEVFPSTSTSFKSFLSWKSDSHMTTTGAINLTYNHSFVHTAVRVAWILKRIKYLEDRCLFFFPLCTGVWTQGLVFASWVLYHLSLHQWGQKSDTTSIPSWIF